MSPLEGVRRFRISGDILDGTLDVLLRAGRDGHEAFVVWGGTVDGDTVTFEAAMVPDQTPHRTPQGLLVTVDGASLHKVNQTMYSAGLTLAGQVHSHPTDAFHSDTDDCYPLVTLRGALSLVIPDFARAGRAGIRDWAWYRLLDTGAWGELTRDDKVELLPGRTT